MSEQNAVAKVKISRISVAEDLKNGLSRKDIGEKYGLNKANLKKLFSDPQLKGLRSVPKAEAQFELEDVLPERTTAKKKVKTTDEQVAVGATEEVVSAGTQAAPTAETEW